MVWRFLVPFVTGTWSQLAVVVSSAKVAAERLVAPRGINYDTG